MKKFQADTLIVGSGLAGLMTAHCLSDDQNVICLTKGQWNECNSYLAQGGIASVTSPEDSWVNHTEDTLIAGRHHNKPNEVAALTQESPDIIQKLINFGVHFDRVSDGDFARTKEGGHRVSRILHAGGDATGKVIMQTLKQHLPSNIHVHEHTQVTELIVEKSECIGLWVRDAQDKPVVYFAHHIILATGGLGQLYNKSSNAITITGDGIALAYRAGACCTDLEFIQFHPTLLYGEKESTGLISEAVRGEGAILVNQDNEPIMNGVHPLKDLAPRDIVARTIFKRVLQGEKISLDINRVKNFENRFPTIYKMCTENGVDLAQKKIPITPGAHFAMGGIKTDRIGRTTLSHLYAVGETAWTGIHGANRLASNSLLEAASFAMKLADFINQDFQKSMSRSYRQEKNVPLNNSPNSSISLPTKKEIQSMVNRCLGIIRDFPSLSEIHDWLVPYVKASESIHTHGLTKDESERLNMLTVAFLITQSAMERTESRGAHYRLDFPDELQDWQQKQIDQELRSSITSNIQ